MRKKALKRIFSIILSTILVFAMWNGCIASAQNDDETAPQPTETQELNKIPVVSINATVNKNFVYHVDGYYESRETESGNVEDYFHYSWQDYCQLEFVLDSGKVIDGYEEAVREALYENDPQKNSDFQIGENRFDITACGISFEVIVNIVDSEDEPGYDPTFPDIVGVSVTAGSTFSYDDYEIYTYFDEDNVPYIDRWINFNKLNLEITVTESNGNDEVYSLNEFFQNFDYDQFEFSTDFSSLEVGINQIEMIILGFYTTFELEITESEIDHIEVTPTKSLRKGDDSFETLSVTYENGELVEHHFEWYEIENCDPEIEVFYKDSTREPEIITKDDESYNYVSLSGTTYNNQWDIGANNKAIAAYKGFICEFYVSVSEGIVESISAEATKSVKQQDVNWTSQSYNDFASLFEPRITVLYKNGDTAVFEYEEIKSGIFVTEEEGNLLHIGSNSFIANYKGKSCTFDAVVENTIESITILQRDEIKENECGNYRLKADGGGLYAWFDYELYRNGFNITVEFTDGSKGKYDWMGNFENGGFRLDYDIEFENRLVPGNNIISASCCGMPIEIPIIISENPVVSISATGTKAVYEGTGGYYSTTYEGHFYESYYYNLSSFEPEFEILYKDKSTAVLSFDQFSDEFGNPYIYYVGEGYHIGQNYLTFSYENAGEYPLEVTITESPVESFSVVAKSTPVAHTGGHIETYHNLDTEQEENWYKYDIRAFDPEITVNFKDGETEVYNCDELYLAGLGDLVIFQDAYNQLAEGDNEVTGYIAGKTAKFNLTLLNDPIESISVAATKSAVEGFDCYLSEEWYGTYLRYPESAFGIELTINYNDGRPSETVPYNEIYEKTGEWFNIEQSYENPLHVGTNDVTAWFMGKRYNFEVTIEPTPVESFSVVAKSSPYEYQNGYYTYGYNSDTGMSEEYYRYDESAFDPEITVNYTNEQTKTVSYNELESENLGRFEIQQSPNNQLTLGDNVVTAYFMGKTATFTVTISEDPVESYSLVATRSASEEWSSQFTYDGHGYYFYYSDYIFGIELVINYKDGRPAERIPYDEIYEKTGEWLNIEQSYEHQLHVGTNEVPVWFKGQQYTLELTVIPSTVESYSVETKATPCAYTGGRYTSDYNYETDEYETWYEYDIRSFEPEITVNYTNGETETVSYDDFLSSSGKYFYIAQNINNQFTVGDNEVTAYIMGKTVNFNVTISEDPIDSISIVSTKSAVEGLDGSNRNDGYGVYTRYEESLFGIELTINYNDGRPSETIPYDEIYEKTGEWFNIEQSLEHPLLVGTNEVTAWFRGRQYTFNVTIDPSPIASISAVARRSVREGVDGYYSGDRNVYWTSDFDILLTVNYKDGTTKEYNYYDSYDKTGRYFYIEEYETDFSVGTKTTTLYYANLSCPVEITVEPHPIDSFSVTFPHVVENTCGWWDEDYDDDGNYVEYYRYDLFYLNPQFTINFSDGTSGTYTYSQLYDLFNGMPYFVQNPQNQLSVGSQTITIEYMGKTCEAELTIIDTVTDATGNYTYYVFDNKAYITKARAVDGVLTVPYKVDGYELAEFLCIEDFETEGGHIYDGSIHTLYVDSDCDLLTKHLEYNRYIGIDNIVIGANVTSQKNLGILENGLFRYAISVDSRNQYFSSEDNTILTKDGSEIIFIPYDTGDYYTVPSCVKSLDFDIFDNISAYDITVPNSVTEFIGYSYKYFYCRQNAAAVDYFKAHNMHYYLIECTHRIFEDWEIVNEPDCNNEGLMTRKCVECDDYVETRYIPSQHVGVLWKWLVKPTDGNDGVKIRECPECGISEEIPSITLDNIGDLNEDGEIDIRDLIRLKKLLANGEQTNYIYVADLNNDYVTDAKDLAYLLRYLLGNIKIYRI